MSNHLIPNAGRAGLVGVTFDGVELSDTFAVADIVTSAAPPIELSTAHLAQRVGSYFTGRTMGERTVTMRLRIECDTRDPLLIAAEWRKLVPTLFKSTPKALRVPHGDDWLFLDVIATGESTIECEGPYGSVELTLQAPDPRFYGAVKSAQTPAGTTAINVGGTIETGATFDLVSSSNVVQVTNVTTGDFVRVPVSASGQHIVIDMAKQSTTTAGGAVIPVDVRSDYFCLLGQNSIKVEGASGTVSWRERWV